MRLEYLPDIGFKLDGQNYNWGENRKLIRDKLQNSHEEDDRTFEIAESLSEANSPNIEQRRDIYEDIADSTNYFFLSYNKDGLLHELEVHWGLDIVIFGVRMEFDKKIDTYIKQLEAAGFEPKEIEDGTYLFEKLKMTISDAAAMGGDGNDLSYFYSSKEIGHLLEG
jgi:hypothetical protein